MYQTGVYRYHTRRILSNHETLEAAVERALTENYETYDDGDNGITFVYDVANDKEAIVGNGTFREIVDSNWDDTLSITPATIATCVSLLR